jgi:hypothetical protein
MSKPKPMFALLALFTATLVSACDPAASLLDTFCGPTSLCTDMNDARCPRPNPDDIKPN